MIPAHFDDRLKPCGEKQGTAELLACLTLVAPTGMTAEDRSQWVAVARQTLKGIPGDLLAEGCAIARRKCRFPSEIVPTIIEATEVRWRWRREDRAKAMQAALPRPSKPQVETIEAGEVRKLIKRLSGLTAA